MLYFSSRYSLFAWDVDLPDLSRADISNVTEMQLSSYMLVFDPSLLTILSPTNFAIYSAYTFN